MEYLKYIFLIVFISLFFQSSGFAQSREYLASSTYSSPNSIKRMTFIIMKDEDEDEPPETYELS